MKNVAVFCGSHPGNVKIYEEQAYLLGATLANQGIRLIYGGARIGLMGTVALGALEQGGQVVGVFPRFLQQKEIAHEGLTKLFLVDTMHERKALMNELADGVITLPGGFGTMEEFFEMLTWRQLGLHGKPVAILNTGGYYDDLIALMQKMVDHGFMKESTRQLCIHSREVPDILQKMKLDNPPASAKFISKETT